MRWGRTKAAPERRAPGAAASAGAAAPHPRRRDDAEAIRSLSQFLSQPCLSLRLLRCHVRKGGWHCKGGSRQRVDGTAA